MGYITFFSLYTYGDENKIKQAEADAKVYDNAEISALVEGGELEAKWYNFYEDFQIFAQRHPDVLFVVYGDGESSDDFWEARFKGEEFEQHCMEMPPFMNPKLKIPVKYINY